MGRCNVVKRVRAGEWQIYVDGEVDRGGEVVWQRGGEEYRESHGEIMMRRGAEVNMKGII